MRPNMRRASSRVAQNRARAVAAAAAAATAAAPGSTAASGARPTPEQRGTSAASAGSNLAPTAAVSESGSAVMTTTAAGSTDVQPRRRRTRRPRTLRPSELTKNGVRQYVKTAHGVKLYLQNCVSTINLKVNPDLAHIATHARNVEYNPKKFSAAVLRLREPKATALVFTSGKMVVTGARNEDDSQLAGRRIARVIQKLGFAAKFSEFKIQNIVSTGDVRFPIRLEGLADEHGRFSSYEPELFPGLIYRMQVPKVVLLVFVSGKVVLTGAKSRGALVEAFNKIFPLLLKYRKAPVD